MGEVALQEQKQKKKSYRPKHNVGDESLGSYCFHQLFVIKVF
jgi:hypothetical protein